MNIQNLMKKYDVGYDINSTYIRHDKTKKDLVEFVESINQSFQPDLYHVVLPKVDDIVNNLKENDTITFQGKTIELKDYISEDNTTIMQNLITDLYKKYSSKSKGFFHRIYKMITRKSNNVETPTLFNYIQILDDLSDITEKNKELILNEKGLYFKVDTKELDKLKDDIITLSQLYFDENNHEPTLFFDVLTGDLSTNINQVLLDQKVYIELVGYNYINSEVVIRVYENDQYMRGRNNISYAELSEKLSGKYFGQNPKISSNQNSNNWEPFQLIKIKPTL